MASDVVREGYLQPAPDLAVLFPRLDLVNREAGIRVEEGLGQVGPHRVGMEIDGVKPIPGGFVGMAGEGATWIVADVNDFARVVLEDEQIRHEANAPTK